MGYDTSVPVPGRRRLSHGTLTAQFSSNQAAAATAITGLGRLDSTYPPVETTG